MKFNFFSYVVALISPVFYLSCSDATKNYSKDKPSQCLRLETSTTWDNGISAIVQKSCTGCHPTYSSYATVSGSITSILASIDSGSMPKGSTMASADKSALHAWSTAGTPQSASTSESPCLH